MMKENEPYTNLLEDVGYQDGYRINSSGNVVEGEGRVLTGFIPFDDVSDNDVIRFKGVTYTDSVDAWVFFYDAERNLLQGVALNVDDYTTAYCSNTSVVYTHSAAPKLTADEKGVGAIKFNFMEDNVVANPVAYFRFVAQGSGSNLIITRNQEIVEYVADEKNVGKVVPDLSGYATKSNAETWTFTLEDGSTVTKKVVLA